MLDLVIRNATLPDGRRDIDIGCENGKIVSVRPALEAASQREIDADGFLVSPPFVDSHFHMDATLSFGDPRVNQSGTLLEGIALWGELKPSLTPETILGRARRLCLWAIAKGNLAIRTHVDICDPALRGVEALLKLREEFRQWIDIQLVAFPQDGYFRDPGAPALLEKALDLGVDVVGGIPHFERTMAEGSRSVTTLCEIAERRGLPVDMHCDETDDPLSRHVETLAFETQRLGLQGRVTGSHLTSMHSMDNYYVSKLMPLMHEAEIQVVANPLINIYVQGRQDSYPKKRHLTRVKELMAHEINVAFGHDCVLDPWYSLGSHDMLEVAHMGLHLGQMTSVEEMHAVFRSVTYNGAQVMGLEGYGLEPGCNADLVVLQACDPIEAIRLRAQRLWVVRRGEVISEGTPNLSELSLGGRSLQTAYLRREIDTAGDNPDQT